MNYNRQLVLLFPKPVITAANKQPFPRHKLMKPLQLHYCVGHDNMTPCDTSAFGP